MPHAQSVSKELWPSQVAEAAGDPTLTPHWTVLGKLVVCADGLQGSLKFQGTV